MSSAPSAIPAASASLGFELVSIPPDSTSKSSALPAWVARRVSSKPSVAPKRAVIFLHEWWGLNAAVQKQASDWFGAESISDSAESDWIPPALLLLPDLFRGSRAESVAEAAHLFQAMEFTQALRDVKAAAKFAREKEGCTKVSACREARLRRTSVDLTSCDSSD